GHGPAWYNAGGPERAEASELFREALALAEYVFGPESPETANACVQLARQLKARSEENGRPEFSRWNRSAGVAESALSTEAQALFQRALEIRVACIESVHQGVPEGEVERLAPAAVTGVSQRDVADCYRSLAQLAQASLPTPTSPFDMPQSQSMYEEPEPTDDPNAET
ncbi:hypothetical protein KIPB_013748, partial [Kipferlia bialata]